MNFFSNLFGAGMPSMNPAELNEKLTQGEKLLVLDVREPVEFISGHIEGAVLIPLGELGQRVQELPKDRPVVCVCESGSRSLSATRYLLSQGLDVINMNRGMIGWQSARLPVLKGDGNGSD